MSGVALRALCRARAPARTEVYAKKKNTRRMYDPAGFVFTPKLRRPLCVGGVIRYPCGVPGKVLHPYSVWRARKALKLVPFLASGALWRQSWLAYSTKEERPVGRYPVPNKKDMPYDIVELMEEVEKKTGFLPNIFKAMSHRPAEFRAFFAYYNAIMNKDTGQLSKADKELIIVATSVVNRCPYCVIAHGALHRIYSKQPALADQVTVNWKLADLSDRELAMLEFALAICRADNITEEHFQKLERHGFGREDAWDIAMISAFFAMSNRIAHFIDLRPNREFYTMGRMPHGEKEDKA